MASRDQTTPDRLTANIRVRLTEPERAALEQLGRAEDRSASAIARRAIRRELDRMGADPSKAV